jgi:hypothetical protein
MTRIFAVFALLAIAVAAQAARFDDLYVEAVWSDLTGFSTAQQYTAGLRNGNTDLYLLAKNETFDTTGTNLPFQYSARGATIGVGARQWGLNHRAYLGISAGKAIDGPDTDKIDFRAGGAGYNNWEQGKRFSDLYGELFYISRADDTFLNVRYRPGLTLHRDENGRLWTYLVGQVWAAANSDLGTENRVELGPGIGYIYRGYITVNLDLRAGHSFHGTITDKDYFNPVVSVAGNF